MKLKISRILHAGYLVEAGATRIAFDPVFENPFSKNCYAYPDVRFDERKIRDLRLSAVFISHFHEDHFSLESLDWIDRKTPVYFYSVHEELFDLIRALGFESVHSLALDRAERVGELEVIPRRAAQVDVDSMFHIRHGELNILNVVDAWIEDETLKELARSAPWDLVLWPFQTLRETDVIAPAWSKPASREIPGEWIEQIRALNPRFLVPSSCQFIQESWSWYRSAFFPISYVNFARQIREGGIEARVVRMNPGTSYELSREGMRPLPPLDFVQPIGSQDVDYDYNAEVSPTPTKEIAKHFPALRAEQRDIVLDYCRKGLAERARELGPPSDSYFNRSRAWKLTLFDHEGSAQEFFYRLDEDKIEPIDRLSEPIGWTTEIPMSKLYGALREGESLTSIYVRINDGPFNAKTAHELASVDVLEDPLLRCLYNGVIGAYQKAQLERLRKGKKRQPPS